MSCADLESALSFYTGQLGFRLDLIFPADAPRVTDLSGYGIRIRLEQSGKLQQLPNGEWGTGRAGMQYRDLIPDRLGGQLIASHIRIPRGGPVPDYVHHHNVEFQMIYCYHGWVKVVYEDQGPPFVLAAGDCVLQPPHIRHRVLECSDHMEVIEVSSPAEHETLVDHEMALPNTNFDANRDFRGQRFVRHESATAEWVPGPSDGLEARDTGIGAATSGLASVIVVRPVGDPHAVVVGCDDGAVFVFVLQGTMTLQQAERESHVLAGGDAFVIFPGTPATIAECSVELELLWFASHAVLPRGTSQLPASAVR